MKKSPTFGLKLSMKTIVSILIPLVLLGFKSEKHKPEDFVHYYVYCENPPFRVTYTGGDQKEIKWYINEKYWRMDVYPEQEGVYSLICKTFSIQEGDSMYCSIEYRTKIESIGLCSDLKTPMILHKYIEVYK